MTHEGWGNSWAEVQAPVAPKRAQLRRPEPVGAAEKRRKRRFAVLFSILGVLVLIAGWGGYVAYQAVHAATALQDAAGELRGLDTQVREDLVGAGDSLTRVQQQTQVAASATSGPLFYWATHLPVVGDDLGALRSVSRVVDVLANSVFPQLTDAVRVVNPETLAPQNGAVDLTPLVEVAPNVIAADRTVFSSLQTIRGIDRTGLIPQLADATDQVETQLEGVSELTATAARAVGLIPTMLGSEGPREWLVIAQNNAEPRALGGIAGSILSLNVDNGRLDFEDKTGAQDFPILGSDITEAEKSLFGDMFNHIQSVTGTPDFPRAAQLATDLWRQNLGGDPSGAIAIDPVALQSIVAVVGDVQFNDPLGNTIVLTGANTSEFLLSQVYSIYPEPAMQDLIFAEAAGAVFERMMGGGFSPTALISALDQAASEGRLMIWSARPAEQSQISGTTLSGEFVGQDVTADGQAAPVVGVYQNILTMSKLGFYLDLTADVTDVEPGPGDSQTFTVNVTVHNSLTPEVAAILPDYVIGSGERDGSNPTILYVSAPTGGSIDEVLDAEGNVVGGGGLFLNDLLVNALEVDAPPGGSVTYRFRIHTGPNLPGPVQLRVTPGAR